MRVFLETGEVLFGLFANNIVIKTGHEVLPKSEQIKTELFSNGLGGLFSRVRTTKSNICEAYFCRKLDIF